MLYVYRLNYNVKMAEYGKDLNPFRSMIKQLAAKGERLVPVITACTVVQCSIMDDSAFLWEHAILGPPLRRNPLTDRYEILRN
jgi:hypothetical protein